MSCSFSTYNTQKPFIDQLMTTEKLLLIKRANQVTAFNS